MDHDARRRSLRFDARRLVALLFDSLAVIGERLATEYADAAHE